MLSLIPRNALGRRLMYELVYMWPGPRDMATFNLGFAPVGESIARDPAFAREPSQIQLYEELIGILPMGELEWQRSSVLEVAAGRGGGLLYLQRSRRPQQAIGIDIASSAARHARRLGADVRQGSATNLRFADRSFDCLICLEALGYFPATEFINEACRVIKPGGRLLIGETFATPAEATARFRQLASIAALEVERFRDASAGVRLSIAERASRISRATGWLPSFIRDRWKETAVLEDSERYRKWQSGALCFAMAVLRRPL